MDDDYHFAIHSLGGFEALGFMPLPDDAGAVSFADGIIRDLMRDGSVKYDAACTMVITQGRRTVARVSFSRANGGSAASQLHCAASS
jgi:hypothetical protein